jgi:hypothetical protein
MDASMTPTKTSMTLKTSWSVTLTLKKKNLKHCHELTSKENGSAYVGTNYKDEPTLDSETRKRFPEQPKRSPEREEVESDHEWLQLIQMEKLSRTKNKNY